MHFINMLVTFHLYSCFIAQRPYLYNQTSAKRKCLHSVSTDIALVYSLRLRCFLCAPLSSQTLGAVQEQNSFNNWPLPILFICLFILGMGYASHLIIAFSATSYIIILAWAFFYLFQSFSGDLPWATCGHYWNTGTTVLVYSKKQ